MTWKNHIYGRRRLLLDHFLDLNSCKTLMPHLILHHTIAGAWTMPCGLVGRSHCQPVLGERFVKKY